MSPAEQLAFAMKRIYEKRLTTTSGGNLSIREDDGSIWITPAAIDKGNLTPEDMVCVRPDGTVEGRWRPSSELPFHANIYRLRSDLRAVIHGHPAGLLAASMVRKCPDTALLPAIGAVCPGVELAAYAVPGSELLGEHIGKCFADGCDLVLLENHGVCVGGADLTEAFCRFEALEYAANLEIQANRLGKPRAAAAEAPKKTAVLDGEAPELTAMVRRADRQGLFTAALGCCSLRGVGTMGVDGVLRKNSELHEAIYAANPEVNAMFEAQPLYAMAFAVTGAEYDTRAIPESYVLLRDLLRLPADASDEEIAAALKETAPAALVENRCALVIGRDLTQAFDRLEVLETTAKALIDTAALGEIVRIRQPQIDEIKAVFRLP